MFKNHLHWSIDFGVNYAIITNQTITTSFDHHRLDPGDTLNYSNLQPYEYWLNSRTQTMF